MKPVHKTIAIDLAQAVLAADTAALRQHAGETPAPSAHPRPLLDMVQGEARECLLAVHGILDARLPATGLSIYEAGGGSTCFLPPQLLRRAHVTVVDIDPDQIRNNQYAHDAILGDIQTHRFAPGSFDLVICYNVIEHLADVETTLLGFREALKPGGLILIGAPNPRSLSGIVAKHTPHWFHIWFYRHVRGEKEAGQPGQAPFPTVFHPLVTLANLEAFANALGLEMIYRREYESPRFPEMRTRRPLLAALLDAFAVALNFLLPGKVDVRRGDYHVILKKR
jgi:SAM-dependent methyltransferase